ncbi:NAD(P)/FAD-dependent oxidoreductase [Acetanaerobacterium elongatum]|uniref:Thioredoxin reductase (NADPH) n=1 Tax=Acetanaerobacterium elongatum TaxID=258515 RepID=A0A1G9VTF3_9FIRM|nr:NAD(P)/FAD-dependent oxidoreductase [Acetanaerobacterium elongatum]SDM75498.1 thioredoxin reductase (NADPH) [Acetanaerobacterium elongatum]
MADIIILGCGPAGISAAAYAVRGGLTVTVIGKDGGSLQKADKIENYYGFSQPISGEELIAAGIEQARRLGAEILTDEVLGIDFDGEQYTVTAKNEVYRAPCVILATGSARRAPNIPRLKEYEGKGVSYCAVCDAFFYRGKDVAVLGSGEYALHEAMELLPVVRSVTLLTNGTDPSIKLPPEIKLADQPIAAFEGEGVLQTVRFKNSESLAVSGVFVALGVAGSSDLARKLGAEINGTSVVVDADMQTALPGLFAAGDCTGGLLQVSKAVYEGAKAGTSAIKYIRALKTK